MPAFTDLPDDEELVIVGAGLAGIDMAHYVQHTTSKSFIVLEARHEIGGTWSQHTYPGVRSDSDMFSYGMSWLPWDKPRAIATGPEILDHIRRAASADQLESKIHLLCQLRHAAWDSASCRWTLTVADAARPGTQIKTIRAQYIYFATGFYDFAKPHLPKFPGLEKFQGTVVHPQFWPADLKYKDKKVVIIGSGSTAATLLPNMANDAEHITLVQRTPGYYITIPTNPPETKFLYRILSPWWAWWCSKWLEVMLNYTFIFASLRFPSFMRGILRRLTKRELPSDIPLDPHFDPPYKPWMQRMCLIPDGDFFAALRSGKASMVTGTIDDFGSNSIVVDGKAIDADLIITATGFDISLLGGATVSVDEEMLDIHDAYLYQGTLVSNLPNFGVATGYTLASWTLATNLSARYMCRILRAVDEKNTDYFVVRPDQPNKTAPPMTRLPIIPLMSGFVQRAAHLFPAAGSRGQWRPRHWIVADTVSALFFPLGKEVQFASKKKAVLATAGAET